MFKFLFFIISVSVFFSCSIPRKNYNSCFDKETKKNLITIKKFVAKKYLPLCDKTRCYNGKILEAWHDTLTQVYILGVYRNQTYYCIFADKNFNIDSVVVELPKLY